MTRFVFLRKGGSWIGAFDVSFEPVIRTDELPVVRVTTVHMIDYGTFITEFVRKERLLSPRAAERRYEEREYEIRTQRY
jgi:hypothetical protein